MSENTEQTTQSNEESTSMGEKLKAATEKVEKQKAERTLKVVKGANLNPKFLESAKAAGLECAEKTGFFKLTAPGVKGKAIYVARRGGRVDLSGFTIPNSAVKQIAEAEAQAAHLGKVRGQLNFDLAGSEEGDAQLLAAFDEALTEAKVVPPAPPKPEKAPRKKKEETAPATEAASASAEQAPAVSEQPNQ